MNYSEYKKYSNKLVNTLIFIGLGVFGISAISSLFIKSLDSFAPYILVSIIVILVIIGIKKTAKYKTNEIKEIQNKLIKINSWWRFIDYDKKIEIYEKFK